LRAAPSPPRTTTRAPDLLVLRGLAGRHVADEPLDISSADLRHPLAAEERDHVVAQPGEGVRLRAGLHRLDPPRAALDDAALGRVEVEQRGDGHLPRLGGLLRRGVAALGHVSRQGASGGAGLVGRQLPEAGNVDPPLRRAAARSRAVFEAPRLGAGLHHTEEEAGELGVEAGKKPGSSVSK
jgi:hypothetical protein